MPTRRAKACKASYDLGKLTRRAEAKFAASRADEDYRALLALLDAWYLVLSNWQSTVDSAWDRVSARVDRKIAVQ